MQQGHSTSSYPQVGKGSPGWAAWPVYNLGYRQAKGEGMAFKKAQEPSLGEESSFKCLKLRLFKENPQSNHKSALFTLQPQALR